MTAQGHKQQSPLNCFFFLPFYFPHRLTFFVLFFEELLHFSSPRPKMGLHPKIILKSITVSKFGHSSKKQIQPGQVVRVEVGGLQVSGQGRQTTQQIPGLAKSQRERPAQKMEKGKARSSSRGLPDGHRGAGCCASRLAPPSFTSDDGGQRLLTQRATTTCRHQATGPAEWRGGG